MKNRKTAIVGAGIGGLATAIAAADGGNHVEVFERSSEIKGVGAGMALWPNATRVLRQLGVLDQCVLKSGPLELLSVRLAGGKVVMKIPTEKFSTPAIALRRVDLHEALLSRLRGLRIQTGQHCLGIREADEGAYLVFKDGERGPYDVVIGADGIRSVLRQYVQGQVSLRYKGYAIWRGIAEAADLCAADGNFFEIWGPGQRFGILPMGQGRVCWYATINQPQGGRGTAREQKEALLKRFGGWAGPVVELIARTPLDALLHSDTYDREPYARWSRGRVVLIGDAVHPIPANLGMGGCMALEDALILGQLLNKPRDVMELFRRFELLRLNRVADISRRSGFIGAIGQLSSPVLTPVRDKLCDLIPGRLFTYTSRAIHSYQAEQVFRG
ncbi:MAG: FAD-dependent monooxygenase [Deltaproteobacteria bacterium]|nr:FAD-dependent monooxygenase [Deltaproteobacteria bacterium]